jgi:hypothetical protein
VRERREKEERKVEEKKGEGRLGREEEKRRRNGKGRLRWGEEKERGRWACGPRERGRERKEEKDKGHMAPCEWLGGDNEIFSNQQGKATWQRELSHSFKIHNLYKLQ